MRIYLVAKKSLLLRGIFGFLREQLCSQINYISDDFISGFYCTRLLYTMKHQCLMKHVKILEDRNGFGKDYTQDQLMKLKSRFEDDDRGYNFTSWNRLRESDGILCRTDYDCLWISGRFLCRGEDLTLSPEVRTSKILTWRWRLRESRARLRVCTASCDIRSKVTLTRAKLLQLGCVSSFLVGFVRISQPKLFHYNLDTQYDRLFLHSCKILLYRDRRQDVALEMERN